MSKEECAETMKGWWVNFFKFLKHTRLSLRAYMVATRQVSIIRSYQTGFMVMRLERMIVQA